MATSPTAEGFRIAFRRPLLTVAEITWRWATGATAAALFICGLCEYLNTLRVNSGELLFLKSRQPYLVSQALAHILRGSMSRVVASLLLAALMLTLLWIVAASAGRIATVRSLLDHTRRDLSGSASSVDTPDDGGRELASNVSTNHVSDHNNPISALLRLNFLRTAVALAAALGVVGAAILAGFASPDSDPQPGLAFLLFLFLAAIVGLIWGALNWLLSLAGMFAVRDGEDVLGSISAAVSLCRERTAAVFGVSIWTGLAHLVVWVGATVVVSMPMGLAGLLPWRLVVLSLTLVTLAYCALADWLYVARLAGYVCIAEMPEVMAAPLPPAPPPPMPPSQQVATPPLLQTTIDLDEVILSDTPRGVTNGV
jgi:hypothetical protein